MNAVALVVGPAGHGVVRHARRLADAAGWPVVDRAADVPHGAWVVLDVTDRLWGPTSDVSGPAVSAALDEIRARGGRVVAGLHDVPFDGDGPVRERRAAVYRCILQRSDAVFVCSEVERGRLADLAPDGPPVAVVPLPVERTGPLAALPPGLPERSVAVLGFVYPGKGHDEVLQAMAGLPADVALVALGRAADGHDDLVTALAGADRPVLVTGHLSDDDLGGWLRGVTVPVAPNRVVSASASIATWWGHGRRPLAPDVAYTREIDPDASALVRYDDDLAGALRAALADPASTRLPVGARPGPDLERVAGWRRQWLERWAA